MKVVTLYQTNEQAAKATQLRLGRIVTMEQKGKLNDLSDESIIELLTSRDEHQTYLDNRLREELDRRKDREA